MKRLYLLAGVFFLLASCATPVLRKDILEQGQRNVPLVQLVQDPSSYVGKLFVLGGIIVSNKVVPDGSTVEAVYVPVDENGYLQEADVSSGRFLASYPKEKGVLDPLMYREGRRITVAGVFIGTRPGSIGEMSYVFPVFQVEEIYLWSEYARPSYPATFFSFGVLFGR
jgi:outer membrane lipoprotein